LQLGLPTTDHINLGCEVAAFLILVSLIPGLQQLMRVTTLTTAQWGMILVASLIGTLWIEVLKLITHHR
jgi:hypothetical protein